MFGFSVAAQNNSLGGKILYLNSGKTPAAGVEISGKSEKLGKANAVYSDSEGVYRLVFPKSGVGHVVELSVGDTDANGQAMEVVNDSELRICRIPEDPSEVFEIIVCKKGERDLDAQKYYKVIKSSADKALAAKKAEWSRLVDQEGKDYKAIAALIEEIDRLEKQADSMSIYKEAYRMASINKDNATKRVLDYLELLNKGESIQEARKVLSVEKATGALEKSG
ncbi:MAG: hypothetical protein KDD04_09175, partial [Sinomicrobium sp.]|nr:hypothetical protein [Sinomicrobium sp.]